MIPTTPSGTRTRSTRRPFGPDPAVDHLADRVGQAGHRAQPVGHGRPPGRRSSRSRSSEVASAPARSARLDVDGVGLEHPVGPLLEQVGGQEQGLVPGRRGGPGDDPAGGLGPAAQLDHGGRRGSDGTVSAYLPGARPPAPGSAAVATVAAQASDHQVVAVDDLGATPRRAARRTGARPTRPRSTRRWRTRPLANTAPSGPAISTASSMANVPADRDHPGREQGPAPLDQGPAGPVVDHDGARRARRRRRSTACGPGAGGAGAGTVPPPVCRVSHLGPDAGPGGVGE